MFFISDRHQNLVRILFERNRRALERPRYTLAPVIKFVYADKFRDPVPAQSMFEPQPLRAGRVLDVFKPIIPADCKATAKPRRIPDRPQNAAVAQAERLAQLIC
jgi:hypothetical protein